MCSNIYYIHTSTFELNVINVDSIKYYQVRLFSIFNLFNCMKVKAVYVGHYHDTNNAFTFCKENNPRMKDDLEKVSIFNYVAACQD